MAHAFIAQLDRHDQVLVYLISDAEYWRFLENKEPILIGATGIDPAALATWWYQSEIADDPEDRGFSMARGFRVVATPHGPRVFRWTRKVPNHHSVTFDATANGSIGSGTATSLTFAHPVASQPNLYLGVFSSHRGGQSVSSATYGGVGLTSRVDTGTGITPRCEFWDLVNPSTGTNNLVFNYSAATNAVGGSHSAYGVNQTTPRRASSGHSGLAPTDTSPHDITESCSSSVDDLGISGLCLDPTHATTQNITFNQHDTDWTKDWDTNNFGATLNNRWGIGSHTAGVSGTLVITHNVTSVDGSGVAYALIIASIQSAASSILPLVAPDMANIANMRDMRG